MKQIWFFDQINVFEVNFYTISPDNKCNSNHFFNKKQQAAVSICDLRFEIKHIGMRLL